MDKKLAAADGAAEAGPGSASAPEAERPLADGARSTKTRSDDMVADARDEAARLRVEVAYQSKEIQRLSREASAGASEKQQLTERLTAAMQQFESHVAANETKISSLRKQWRRQLELFQKKGLLRATLSAAAGPSNQGIDSGFAQKLKDEVMDLTRRLSEAEIRIRNQADDISAKKHALKELEVALIKNGSRRRRRGLVRERVSGHARRSHGNWHRLAWLRALRFAKCGWRRVQRWTCGQDIRAGPADHAPQGPGQAQEQAARVWRRH